MLLKNSKIEEDFMVGKHRRQLSIMDGAFNNRKKPNRIEKLLEHINELVDW